MISKETITLINTFKNPIINLLGDIKDEVKFYFDTGIINYVETIRKKYTKTKTFLYRLENIDFYDVYFPVTLRHKKEKNYFVDDIGDLFKFSNYISIIGNAGSGKSMLLKHVFLKSIKQIIKIPIVIELRNLNDFEGTFIEYLNNILSGKKLTPNKKILERILTNGEFLFLLDGYDEIYSSNKNKITSELIEFIDNYSNNYFIITSRPGANVETLPRFEIFFVNSLSIKQVEEFIKFQLKNNSDVKLANKIIEVVNKPENKDYNSYLRSPLLLSMFILTFNSYPELPKSKNKFYWNVFDTLCTKHDAFTKYGGFQHERKTGLQNEDFENILKWFSYSSLFKGKYSFDNQYLTQLLRTIKEKLNLKCNLNDLIHDLTVAISIIIIDGLEYKFPHKSLQEYFAALLIKEQDDDVKAKIYSEKLDTLSRHTFTGNENFWNLCFEMDEIAFKKYFILYNLEKFHESINNSSNEERVKSFIKYLQFKQAFNINNEGAYIFNGFQWHGLIIFNILNYLKIFNIHDISITKLNEVEYNFLASLIEAKKVLIIENKEDPLPFLIDYTGNWNDDIYDFLKKVKIEEKILNVLSKIEAKIKELKNEINMYKKTNSELLDL